MLWLDLYLGTFGGRSLVGRRSVRVWAAWLALLVGVAVVLWLARRLGLVAGWSVRFGLGLPTGPARRSEVLARGSLKRGGETDEDKEARPGCHLLEVGWLVLVGWFWSWCRWLVRSVGSVGRWVACWVRPVGRLPGCCLLFGSAVGLLVCSLLFGLGFR